MALMCLSFSGCAALWSGKVAVELPRAPLIATCPAMPQVQGNIVSGMVMMKMEDATALRNWIHSYMECRENNEAEWEGYTEKLEARLRAVAEVKARP